MASRSTNISENVEKLAPLYTASRNVKWCTLEKQLQFVK